jgi:hypothetical protein
MISNQDKLACAMRELRLRRQVYERRVGNGTMSESQAAREIELMTAIADDYRELVGREALPLFVERPE